ncbi:MAG: hypothetical protein PVH24_02695 [Candidatus Zixiibacteriota bacterium]|jgi:hypothetical protein
MTKACAIVVLALIMLAPSMTRGSDDLMYRCGNADGSPDGKLTLNDVVTVIGYIYFGLPAPPLWHMALVVSDTVTGPTAADVITLFDGIYTDGGVSLQCPFFNIESQDTLEEIDPEDTVVHWFTEVTNGNLHIHHLNAYYERYVLYRVYFMVYDDHIQGYEYDNGSDSPIDLYFDLESVLYNVKDGKYAVSVLDFMGDSLGLDTVVIEHGKGLLYYDQEDCLTDVDPSSADEITYWYHRDTVRMSHTTVASNCDADFVIQYARAGDTLRFYEHNIQDYSPGCDCYYNLEATSVFIPEGTYIAEVYQKIGFRDNDPPLLLDRQVVVLQD